MNRNSPDNVPQTKVTPLPTQSKPTHRNKQKRFENRLYKRFLLLYFAVLLVIGAVCLVAFQQFLLSYEAAQPMHCAEQHLQEVLSVAKQGSAQLEKAVTVYDGDSDALAKRLLAAGDDLSLNRMAGGEENESLYAASDAAGTMLILHLNAGKTVTRLMLFSLTDWSCSAVTTPPVTYQITLDETLTLYQNDKPCVANASGLSADTANRSYSVSSDKGNITVVDAAKTRQPFVPNTPLKTISYTITIPDTCILSVGGNSISNKLASPLPSEASAYLDGLCQSVPGLMQYRFSLLNKPDAFTVTDPQGKSDTLAADDQNTTLSAENIFVSDTPPAGTLTNEEVLDVAKLWNLFMTDDLGGTDHGLYLVSDALVQNSTLSHQAAAWARGIDITFINDHTLSSPPFEIEEVGKYITYGDDGFSCAVRLVKTLYMSGNVQKTDQMHARLYFARQDGKWRLAGICDITKEDPA